MHDCPRWAAATVSATFALIHAATAVAAPSHDPVERAVLDVLSHQRARLGAPPLQRSGTLHRVADHHSRTMAQRGRLDHGGWEERARGVAVGRFGETIAAIPSGTRLARRVVQAWMASPPHRAILMDPGLRRIGVARRASGLSWFFTADAVEQLRRR